MAAEVAVKEKVEGKKRIRNGVFWPSFLVVGGAAAIGFVNNKMLADIGLETFLFSLRTFGWLYQIVSIAALVLVGIITFSKLGTVRFGGKEAKPKYSFMAWFAMALTGGIATGVVTYGVNEPIIYFGNIYGEIAQTGVEPGTLMAGIYAIGRCFYNWTFIPYAMYSLCGLAVAYIYFNLRKPLSVTATLIPLFGEKVTQGFWASLIDTLSLLAIALGLASSLGAGLALVGSGVETAFGIKQGPMVWLMLTLVITITFIMSSLMGLDKGIQRLSDINAKVFYVLLAVLIVVGPIVYVLRISTAGMAFWLQNFWIWGLDPIDVGGEALVMWWTLYDWAIWIAYAPLMGLFLAIISYGRTIREFMIINWVMPSVFSIIWFGVWGSTAIYWQQEGQLDLVKTITDSGAVAGLWSFLQHMPMGMVFIPIVMITLVLSFATCADSMTRTIAGLCMENTTHDEEPPAWQKLLWGLTISSIAFFMVAFAGGEQGVDGVKYLAAAGGTAVLFVFVLQLFSIVKMFFIDQIVE